MFYSTKYDYCVFNKAYIISQRITLCKRKLFQGVLAYAISIHFWRCVHIVRSHIVVMRL